MLKDPITFDSVVRLWKISAWKNLGLEKPTSKKKPMDEKTPAPQKYEKTQANDTKK